MTSAILNLIHAAQAAFSAYNLYLASISISNLQTYEDKAKKAAEYSNIAGHQLHKTRTTQASGTIAILISFLSSVSLITYGPNTSIGKLIVAGLNLAVLEGARRHVGEFWSHKKKIPLPGLGAQNEATGKTQEVRLNMLYLQATWIVGGLLGLVL